MDRRLWMRMRPIADHRVATGSCAPPRRYGAASRPGPLLPAARHTSSNAATSTAQRSSDPISRTGAPRRLREVHAVAVSSPVLAASRPRVLVNGLRGHLSSCIRLLDAPPFNIRDVPDFDVARSIYLRLTLMRTVPRAGTSGSRLPNRSEALSLIFCFEPSADVCCLVSV
jgi:hypothetical protein